MIALSRPSTSSLSTRMALFVTSPLVDEANDNIDFVQLGKGSLSKKKGDQHHGDARRTSKPSNIIMDSEIS